MDIKKIISNTQKNIADTINRTILEYRANSFAKEASIRGPWLRNVHAHMFVDMINAYHTKNANDPTVNKRSEKVFGGILDLYADKYNWYCSHRMRP